jgi:hypothetical protein
MTRGPRRPGWAPRSPVADDCGGVWIVTGVLLCILVYAGVVLMDIAGFTAVLPLVVIPPVLVALIAGSSLLGGGRGSGRRGSTGRPPPDPR